VSSISQNYRPHFIIGLSFVALALTFSARATLGLVMPILEQELGWTRSFTSGAAAIALLLMAAIAPFGGRLVDKQGSRAILMIGLGALAIGCFLVAVTASPLAFFLAFSGVAAVGFGLVATHVVSTAVEQEVTKNKGLATGIATSGSTGGQFVFVPLLAILVGSYDWRLAFVALGLGALVIMACIYLWFPKHTPSTKITKSTAKTDTSLGQDIVRILKLPAFQILFWSYFICGYTTYRVDTPAGSVVIGGDAGNDAPKPPRSMSTSAQVEKLAMGADIIVHSAIHPVMGPNGGSGFPPPIYFRQSTATDLGAMATRTGAKHLLLTHLIPPMNAKKQGPYPIPGGGLSEDDYKNAVIEGGFAGNTVVGIDLVSITLPQQ
jgi:MFS family permease